MIGDFSEYRSTIYATDTETLLMTDSLNFMKSIILDSTLFNRLSCNSILCYGVSRLETMERQLTAIKMICIWWITIMI